ncbi:unnamed protein product [Phaedon cochleariae]|uniref:Phospholipid/glycerol acyltransferase domain-containing protein n=1 Tax=Phaedon cochleariae TaxID=80249 RepID=A0A9P0DH81_PHACE|nr:unnamed protein product [Phaedon cochleariae]
MDLSNLELLKRSRIVHLCMGIAFFTSGVIVNSIQCLLYLTLRPFNKVLYRKINWYLCCTIYSQLVFLGDWWSNSRIIFYVDRADFDKYYGKEHAYCVMNHTYEIDWLIGWMIADRIHLLGNCKAYAKKVIQYVPVLGWAWKCSEFVFLERNFDKDKEVIHKQITELSDHPDPMWLLMFPEGTRFTKKKLEASQEFAIKNNLPELNHHLMPRSRGFIASLPPMKGKVPALYQIELAFKEDAPSKPTITTMLFGQHLEAHIYMKRILMENIPDGKVEQEKFLRDLFVEKDKLKDSFLKTGDFFATSGVQRVEPFEIPRRFHSIFHVIFWQLVAMLPIAHYLLMLLLSGEVLYFSIGASIIGAFFILMKKTIGMTEIKKGSSYGSSGSAEAKKAQ